MNTMRLTTDDQILCLSCGVEDDGIILNTEERPDLIGEECGKCGRVGA